MNNINQSENESLEAQAKQITSLLDRHAQRLSMRTLKKLEDGRDRAIKAHEQGGVSVNADGTLSHFAVWADHHRIIFSGLVLVAMMSTFIVLQAFNVNETSDAFLLGADLPPEAFVDQGFEPSLNRHASL